MPYSYGFHDKFVKDYVEKNYATGIKILDIGAGAGKYGQMFKDKYHVDAIEVFMPNIVQFKLHEIYKKVMCEDVKNFVCQKGIYQLAIMGDVLEHLRVDEAKAVLSNLHRANIDCLVLVPYEYHQGASGGNQAEIHHQPDLTEKVFKERYPEFQLICGNNKQGVYFRSSK